LKKKLNEKKTEKSWKKNNFEKKTKKKLEKNEKLQQKKMHYKLLL